MTITSETAQSGMVSHEVAEWDNGGRVAKIMVQEVV